ncbi:hypothetical protein [Helicobacter sp. T3_23-1056]
MTASIVVIASERSERGNLQCKIGKVDCHALDSAKKAESNCSQ